MNMIVRAMVVIIQRDIVIPTLDLIIWCQSVIDHVIMYVILILFYSGRLQAPL
jgi:hypothetical protein